MNALTVSTPGKLILMGEHAVVYGHPALVAAVSLRLRARFRSPPDPAGATVELRLPTIGVHERVPWEEVRAYAAAARERWNRWASGEIPFELVLGADPAHSVKVSLGEASLHLREERPPPVAVEVVSDLPVGSGLGSSAALAVAVAGGYLLWRDPSTDLDAIERVALEAERRQHGAPSGVDGATVLRGGLVWAEFREGRLRSRPMDTGAGGIPAFRVYDTGRPAQSTGEVVAAVRERKQRDPGRIGQVLEEMGCTTRRFRDAVLAGANPATIAGLVRRYERGLEALGVVPEALRERIRRLEAAGGAAKISGAGALGTGRGGTLGAGTLLAYHPDPRSAEAWEALEDLSRLHLELGAEGLRWEEA